MQDDGTGQRIDTAGGAARFPAWMAVTGLFANVGTPIIIDYWIIRIRWEYIEIFPQVAARKPPTISRAMADIPLGNVMAFWLCICAVLLVIGAGLVSLLYVRSARALPAPPRSRRRIALLGFGIVAIQLPVSLGMVLQSVYSLKTANELHMIGSYLLFVSAGIGQIVSIVVSTVILRRMQRNPELEHLGLIHPTAARMRNWFAGCALVLTVGYLALFILKDTSFYSPTLYDVYVSTEVVLIAALMAYLMFHGIEFARIIYRGSRSASASRKPAPPVAGQ